MKRKFLVLLAVLSAYAIAFATLSCKENSPKVQIYMLNTPSKSSWSQGIETSTYESEESRSEGSFSESVPPTSTEEKEPNSDTSTPPEESSDEPSDPPVNQDSSGNELTQPPPHSHAYGAWEKDGFEHWKTCSCGKESERGEHSLDENNACERCDYRQTGGVRYCLSEDKTYAKVLGLVRDNPPTSVTIADTYFNKPVREIDEFAFSGSDITEIYIPDTVTKIGGYSFRGCRELVRFHAGKGVMTIGMNAFAYCKKLASVSFGRDLMEVGISAFAECEALTELVFADTAGWKVGGTILPPEIVADAELMASYMTGREFYAQMNILSLVLSKE